MSLLSSSLCASDSIAHPENHPHPKFPEEMQMTYQIPKLRAHSSPLRAKSLPSAVNSTPHSQGRATPTFLDTINDFSDTVDFYAKADQIAHGEEPTGKEMSQKNCRFCH